jgi:hypothetical protein
VDGDGNNNSRDTCNHLNRPGIPIETGFETTSRGVGGGVMSHKMNEIVSRSLLPRPIVAFPILYLRTVGRLSCLFSAPKTLVPIEI